MSEARPRRRTLWRTALKALGLAAGVVALLAATGFILASNQVRWSSLGEFMEQRFPIRWSEITLVFGEESERALAANTLGSTGSPRALGALERAARDRSPEVRDEAVDGIKDIARGSPREAVPVLLRMCRAGRPDVRLRAYRPVPPDGLLLLGLSDPNPTCRAVAALSATMRLPHEPRGQGLPSQMAPGLERCLLGPSPLSFPVPGPPYCCLYGPRGERTPPPHKYPRVQPRQVGGLVVQYEGDRDPTAAGNAAERLAALYWLWLEGTEQGRKRVREELEKRPLIEAAHE